MIKNIRSGETCTLPRPVYAISHDGNHALSLNFSRLSDVRPGYGYISSQDACNGELSPDNDGIYLMDLPTGNERLIVSLKEIAEYDYQNNMSSAKHWFDHLLFSPDNSRFVFFHRWVQAKQGNRALGPTDILPGGLVDFCQRYMRTVTRDKEHISSGLRLMQRVWRKGRVSHYTRLFTSNIRGADTHCFQTDGLVSHLDWLDSKRIICWARIKDGPEGYYLYRQKPTHRTFCSRSIDR